VVLVHVDVRHLVVVRVEADEPTDHLRLAGVNAAPGVEEALAKFLLEPGSTLGTQWVFLSERLVRREIFGRNQEGGHRRGSGGGAGGDSGGDGDGGSDIVGGGNGSDWNGCWGGGCWGGGCGIIGSHDCFHIVAIIDDDDNAN
jgi:hypothetical protein